MRIYVRPDEGLFKVDGPAMDVAVARVERNAGSADLSPTNLTTFDL